MEMTGRENIYLKGYVLGLEDSYIKQIEEKIIDFAELGDYIDQPVRTYSSGMKMRLGFAINVNCHMIVCSVLVITILSRTEHINRCSVFLEHLNIVADICGNAF